MSELSYRAVAVVTVRRARLRRGGLREWFTGGGALGLSIRVTDVLQGAGVNQLVLMMHTESLGLSGVRAYKACFRSGVL